MAKVTFSYPYEQVLGKLNKKDPRCPVQRQKKFRDSEGRIIGVAKSESFIIKNPRDLTVKPLAGEQLENVTTFKQAVAIAQAERANPERLAYWTERWKNQLKKGELDAPINPSNRQHRIYMRLDIFIQTVIQRELKAGTWQLAHPINQQ